MDQCTLGAVGVPLWLGVSSGHCYCCNTALANRAARLRVDRTKGALVRVANLWVLNLVRIP
jgi:hypothetical protein